MKKVKFEKLNDAKFQKLEIDKMKEVKGGICDTNWVHSYSSGPGYRDCYDCEGCVDVD